MKYTFTLLISFLMVTTAYGKSLSAEQCDSIRYFLALTNINLLIAESEKENYTYQNAKEATAYLDKTAVDVINAASAVPDLRSAVKTYAATAKEYFYNIAPNGREMRSNYAVRTDALQARMNFAANAVDIEKKVACGK